MLKYFLLICISIILLGCNSTRREGYANWDIAYRAVDNNGNEMIDNKGRPLYYFEKLIPVKLDNGSIVYIDAYTGERRSPVRLK